MIALTINIQDLFLKDIDIQKEILYGGYLPALVAPSLVITVSILSGLKINIPILIIAYLIPLIVYSYDYYQNLDNDQSTNLERTSHLRKKADFYPYILFSYLSILLVLLILFANLYLIAFIFLLIISGILYEISIKRITREITAFKNYYTALTWAAAGTLFPVLYNANPIQMSHIILMTFIFLKCLLNVIFFDLKDIKSDKNQNLRTLPVLLGKKKTLELLKYLNLFSLIPLFIGISLGIIPNFAIILTFFYFYTIYYLEKSQNIPENDLGYISSTLADFEFILWPLMVFLAGRLIPF